MLRAICAQTSRRAWVRLRVDDRCKKSPSRHRVRGICPSLRTILTLRHSACMKRWTGYCFVFALAGCSTTFSPQPCDVDADCDSGSVCEMRETVPVCVPAEDAPLLIGSSSAISGTD